jgi:hypothetical protein
MNMSEFDKLGTPVDEMLEEYCKQQKPGINKEMANNKSEIEKLKKALKLLISWQTLQLGKGNARALIDILEGK